MKIVYKHAGKKLTIERKGKRKEKKSENGRVRIKSGETREEKRI